MRRVPPIAVLCAAVVLPCWLAGCASSASEGPLTLKAERKTFSSAELTYLADYPSLPGHRLATERVAAIVDQALGEFVAAARGNRKAWEATASAEEKARGLRPYECLIGWRGERVDAEAISLLIDVYYFAGGAHGISYLRSVNYDPRSRSFISLGHLLEKLGDTWIDTVAIRARAELEVRLNPDQDPGLSAMIEEGTAPLPANYECFTFGRSALAIHFQKYQVGPGVLGSQSVILPLDLRDPVL